MRSEWIPRNSSICPNVGLTKMQYRPVEMWWHTRRNQISSFVRNGPVHLNRRGTSIQSTTGSRGVRISGSNAGTTMFRGSVKGTGYPLHSPVSPSFPLPCVTVCHHVSTGLYSARSLCCEEQRAITARINLNSLAGWEKMLSTCW